VCAESKKVKHSKCLQGVRKECVQVPLKESEWGTSRGAKPLKLSKTAQEMSVPRSPQGERKGIDDQGSQRKYAISRQPLDHEKVVQGLSLVCRGGVPGGAIGIL
jgi:hypothetical protein